MKIKLYWPRCNFPSKQRADEEIDSYWVECTLEEAEINVFPRLSLAQIEISKKNWEPKENDSKDIVIDTNSLCYLVSKNLRSITSFPWYYPYSGQWNGYSPFEEMREIEIKDLKDIATIINEV